MKIPKRPKATDYTYYHQFYLAESAYQRSQELQRAIDERKFLLQVNRLTVAASLACIVLKAQLWAVSV